MEIKTITYKRINNLGNYNSEHLEMFAELGREFDVDQCFARLKNQVETALGLIETEPAPAPKPANYDKDLF